MKLYENVINEVNVLKDISKALKDNCVLKGNELILGKNGEYVATKKDSWTILVKSNKFKNATNGPAGDMETNDTLKLNRFNSVFDKLMGKFTK